MHEHADPLSGGYHGSAGLAIVVSRASWTVGDRPRRPVDRARAVENAQNAFPTSSLDGAQSAPPTRPTRLSSSLVNEKERRANYNDVLHPWRLIKNTDVLASRRSDHDGPESAITMAWTK
jgi:hypothetical protein